MSRDETVDWERSAGPCRRQSIVWRTLFDGLRALGAATSARPHWLLRSPLALSPNRQKAAEILPKQSSKQCSLMIDCPVLAQPHRSHNVTATPATAAEQPARRCFHCQCETRLYHACAFFRSANPSQGARYRSLHSMPQLRHGLEFKENGIPGFMSPDVFKLSWHDYQGFLINKLNLLTEGERGCADLQNVATNQACHDRFHLCNNGHTHPRENLRQRSKNGPRVQLCLNGSQQPLFLQRPCELFKLFIYGMKRLTISLLVSRRSSNAQKPGGRFG